MTRNRISGGFPSYFGIQYTFNLNWGSHEMEIEEEWRI